LCRGKKEIEKEFVKIPAKYVVDIKCHSINLFEKSKTTFLELSSGLGRAGVL